MFIGVFLIRLQKIRYLFVGGFQVTHMWMWRSFHISLDEGNGPDVFSQNSGKLPFRWSSAPPIVRLMGNMEPCERLAADAFCYKRGQVWSCGQVRGWFSKVKGLYFHFYTSPVHDINGMISKSSCARTLVHLPSQSGGLDPAATTNWCLSQDLQSLKPMKTVSSVAPQKGSNDASVRVLISGTSPWSRTECCAFIAYQGKRRQKGSCFYGHLKGFCRILYTIRLIYTGKKVDSCCWCIRFFLLWDFGRSSIFTFWGIYIELRIFQSPGRRQFFHSYYQASGIILNNNMGRLEISNLGDWHCWRYHPGPFGSTWISLRSNECPWNWGITKYPHFGKIR